MQMCYKPALDEQTASHCAHCEQAVFLQLRSFTHNHLPTFSFTTFFNLCASTSSLEAIKAIKSLAYCYVKYLNSLCCAY